MTSKQTKPNNNIKQIIDVTLRTKILNAYGVYLFGGDHTAALAFKSKYSLTSEEEYSVVKKVFREHLFDRNFKEARTIEISYKLTDSDRHAIATEVLEKYITNGNWEQTKKFETELKLTEDEKKIAATNAFKTHLINGSFGNASRVKKEYNLSDDVVHNATELAVKESIQKEDFDTATLILKEIKIENEITSCVAKIVELNNTKVEGGLLDANEKLVSKFGASKFDALPEIPDFRTFQNGLFYSHRDFELFYGKLKNGEKSAIVSGLNPSGRLHLGHKVVFDTCLYFQKQYGLKVYIPLSDDESYVSGRVATRASALVHAISLVKGMLAYGFDPEITKVILDHNYPEIFNIAINMSKGLTATKVKGVYGYSDSTNIGLFFYPAVQAAHVIFPEVHDNIKNTLVPIGPDEDAHLRIGRDMAEEMGYAKPAILHAKFMPDMNLKKMSKSRPDGVIYLTDNVADIKKKVQRAFSGGKGTIEEHRKLGGNPDIDVALIYLSSYFLRKSEGDQLKADYKAGTLLSGEVKKMLCNELVKFSTEYNKRLSEVTEASFIKMLMPKETLSVDPILLKIFRDSK